MSRFGSAQRFVHPAECRGYFRGYSIVIFPLRFICFLHFAQVSMEALLLTGVYLSVPTTAFGVVIKLRSIAIIESNVV